MKKQILLLLLLTGVASTHASDLHAKIKAKVEDTINTAICRKFISDYTKALEAFEKTGLTITMPIDIIDEQDKDTCIKLVHQNLDKTRDHFFSLMTSETLAILIIGAPKISSDNNNQYDI